MLPRKRGMWCPFVNGHCQALPDESGPASFCRPSLIRTLFVGFCADKCAPGWGSLSDQKDGHPRQLLNRGKFSATNLDDLGFRSPGPLGGYHFAKLNVLTFEWCAARAMPTMAACGQIRRLGRILQDCCRFITKRQPSFANDGTGSRPFLFVPDLTDRAVN
jgi:hypothetical protein